LDYFSDYTTQNLSVYNSEDITGLDVKINLDLSNLLVSKYLLQVLLLGFKPKALRVLLIEAKGAPLINLLFRKYSFIRLSDCLFLFA